MESVHKSETYLQVDLKTAVTERGDVNGMHFYGTKKKRIDRLLQ